MFANNCDCCMVAKNCAWLPNISGYYLELEYIIQNVAELCLRYVMCFMPCSSSCFVAMATKLTKRKQTGNASWPEKVCLRAV